jgi:hypothetical protein
MARVRFTEDFDYKPTKSCTVAYLSGMEMTVKRECAEQAIAAGKAISLGGARSATQKVNNDGETESAGAAIDSTTVENPRQEDHGSGHR